MKVIYRGALASALMVCVVPAFAQSTAPAATLAPPAPTAPLAVAAPAVAADANVLRAGTPIKLKMAEMITTKGKKLVAGYLAHLEVMDDVMVNGVVAIPKGKPGDGRDYGRS